MTKPGIFATIPVADLERDYGASSLNRSLGPVALTAMGIGGIIGTGFPYRENTRYLDEYLHMMKAVIMNTAGVRRPGAASLDLAYVAAGRLDAFWEIGLSPWDTAAGTLLIQEAGGRIGTLSGGEYTQGGNILCGTPKVYDAMLELLAPHLPESLREG